MKIGKKARLLFIDYEWQCEFCMKPMSLPGIAPDLKMLIERKWMYCPYCGRKIDYENTAVSKKIFTLQKGNDENTKTLFEYGNNTGI